MLGGHRVDLAELKARLAERGLTHLLCEGGPHLLRDLLDQGVLDEMDATRRARGWSPGCTRGSPTARRSTYPSSWPLLLEEEDTLLGRWFVRRNN